MDWKIAATIFGSVFLAELGDKTQLATMIFAAEAQTSRWVVFLAAAGALVLSSALAVLAGEAVARVVPPEVLRWAAGLGFIAIGGLILWRG